MYVCQNCGFHSPKWFGKCPSCESWNSLVYEEEIRKKKKKDKQREISADFVFADEDRKPRPVSDILSFHRERRIKTGFSELDRVLGGGIVRGAVLLLAGEPGVGKSTLLLQTALSIAKKGKVLYVSSEESPLQIGMRVKRVCDEEKAPSNLLISFEGCIETALLQAENVFKDKKKGEYRGEEKMKGKGTENINSKSENKSKGVFDKDEIRENERELEKDNEMLERDKKMKGDGEGREEGRVEVGEKIGGFGEEEKEEEGEEWKREEKLLILDAVQSFFSDEIESAPGTVTQVREVARKSLAFARKTGIPVFLIGHVTKEGVVAGPKVLEHMVDVVLYVEPEGMWRVVRATKNRFGSTGELGLFTMTEKGLREVPDPSVAFLDEDILGIPGVVLSAVLEGTRVYIVEVQALVSKTYFSVPRRVSQGYDIGRLNTLLAVLEKHGGLSFWDKDVFLNIAGGMRVSDIAIDLAVSLALLSSYYGIPLGRKVAFGEVGLLGEIRTPSFLEQRLKEVERIKPDEVITGKIKITKSGVVSFHSISEIVSFIKNIKDKVN